MDDYKRKFEKGFQRLGLAVIRYRRVILLMTVVVAALAVVQLPKLRIATSVESMFARHDPTLTAYQRFRMQFGRDEDIVLLVSAADIFSPQFLKTLKQFHADLTHSVPLLKEVVSLVNAPCIVGSDGDLRVTGFLDDLPRTDREARRYRARGHAQAGLRNLYFSADDKHAMVVIKTRAVSALTADGRRLHGYARGIPGAEEKTSPGRQRSISQVENIAVIGIVEAVIKEYQAPDFQIAFSGTPVYQYHVEPMVRANMKKMCIAILMVPVFLMPFVFGRGSGAFFPQVTAVLGLTVALGAMALLSVPFSMSSAMLPATLLSIGLTAPIHFLVVYYKYQKRVGTFRGIVATMKHSGFPITMTSITTVAGLLSFSFSDIVPIAHLVNFTVVGILAILVFTLFSMPAFLSILQVVEGSPKSEAQYEVSRLNRFLLALGRFGVTRPYLVLGLFVAGLLVAGVHLPRLHFSHNQLHYFSEDSEFMRQARLIESQTGGFRALEIMIATQRTGGLVNPARIAAMEELAAYLRAQTDAHGAAYVGRTRSFADLVREFTDATARDTRDPGTIPANPRPLAARFARMQQVAPGVLRKYADADLRIGRLTAMMYWRDAAQDVDFMARVRNHAAGLFDPGVDLTVTGAVSIDSGILHAMMTSLAAGYGTGFLLIAALMILAVGDLRLGLLAMFPNLFPIVIALGVMGALDIPLNIYNLIGGGIAVGLAVDDTIHFFHNFRRYYLKSGDVHYAVRETLRSAGRALLATTLILVASFWMRLISDLKVVADFGLVMGIALLSAFVADVVLAPALLRVFCRAGQRVPVSAFDLSREPAA